MTEVGKERDIEPAALEQGLPRHDADINALMESAGKREARLAARIRELAEANGRIEALRQTARSYAAQVESLVQAVDALKLAKGQEAYAVIKASDVMVAID